MSYCRLADGSDVYVFATTVEEKTAIECCGCSIDPSNFFYADDEVEMIRHLRSHLEEGHAVRHDVFLCLLADFLTRRWEDSQ